MMKRFFFILCVLFVLVLSISGEISAQEKRDSVRIYFHQGKVNIDTCLLDNGNEMERFAKICSALNDSVRLIRKIQIIGGASPEGGGLLNGRLSEKRAEVLWRYISPYIKIPVLEWDFHFSGSDWNGLITMVRADVNVPEREDVLRLLEKIVRLENQDSPYLRGELKRLKGGRPYSYLYKFHFPKLRSSMVKICYDSDPINPVRDTVYIHTRDTLCIRDTVTVIAPVKKRPFCMAVKTNLLYDAVLIPDIGVEFCLGKNWSVAGNWMYAWWKSDRKHNYWRIYGGDVELRRWFGRRAVEKPFSGHHVGLYGQIVTYDFELGGKGYLGDKWSYGGGVAYGYSLPVGHRFNVDFTLGIGYLGGSYKEYIPLDGHYVWQTTKKRRWFGPTKAGISLVWLIGRGNYNEKKGGRQ